MTAIESRTRSRSADLAILAAIVAATTLPFFVFDSTLTSRLISVVSLCLLLWLSEIVPAFVPTLLLWVLIPLILAPIDPKYSLANTLSWAADPVLGLFFGGFALGAAAERCGLSHRLSTWAVARSGNSFHLMLAITMGLTAFVSMWISNIAAAALMFGALRPIIRRFEPDDRFRRMLLVGTAFAANLGGMATPVGTGPNAIAISSVSNAVRIDFLHWMAFALPLTTGLLLLAFVLISWRVGSETKAWRQKAAVLDQIREDPDSKDRNRSQFRFLFILAVCIILWLSEPIHGVAAAVVAIGAAASLFLFRSLISTDLGSIDWSTLLLIAGGITLGRLLEASGLVHAAASGMNLGGLDPTIIIFVLCLGSALLAALMSNTATAVLLIPLAGLFVPSPSTAIIVAVSASFGMMFAISTPQNAMAHGEGARSSDLFVPGLIIMLTGCILVSISGKAVLNLAGIP